ncbi:MAG: hypothetical protein QW041_00170 [Candidatus Pacearchaeota archaeon]
MATKTQKIISINEDISKAKQEMYQTLDSLTKEIIYKNGAPYGMCNLESDADSLNRVSLDDKYIDLVKAINNYFNCIEKKYEFKLIKK